MAKNQHLIKPSDEHFSREEVAQALGLTIKQVKRAERSAFRKLREWLNVRR